MANICEPLNPLQREGSAQRSRLLDALRPENAKVDDREIKDWLLYARKYADLVRFYDLSNEADGDWSEFFDKDISILVALVADEDASEMQDAFDDLKEKVACADLRTELTEALGYFLGHMTMVADKLVTWERRAIPELSLHKTLSRLRASIIRDGFDRLYQYLVRAVELGVTPTVKGKGPIDLQMIELTWPITPPSNGTAFLPKGLPRSAKQLEIELDFLDRLFKRFMEVMHALVRQAPAFMDETLEKYPNHEPYMALFLAFLKLMQVAQDHMNSLTKRHLDFYYKEVLQLQPRPAEPDKVHLILELAQNFNKFPLEEGTLFDAGKIGENDVTFKADNEVVINRGKLADDGLKTIFLAKDDPERDEDGNLLMDEREILNIYAAKDADSQDGEGTPFEEVPGKWDTLGSEVMPYGTVGFAIASPMLYLQEGTRTVTFNFFFENLPELIDRYGLSIIKSELKHNVDIYLSGEKGWIEIPVEEREIDINTEVTFFFTLSNEDEAVVAYDDEVLEDGFDTTLPVIKFVLDNEGLDTFRDVDLNLSAGVATFEIIRDGTGIPEDSGESRDEVLLFLPGEFVAIVDGDDKQIFRFNRDFVIDVTRSEKGDILIEPEEIDDLLNTPLWEKQESLTFESYQDRPYEPGELVQVGDQRFISTADVENIEPTAGITLWQDFSDNTYDATLSYKKGDIVSLDGQIWAARIDVEPNQSPPDDGERNTYWYVLEDFKTGTEYEVGDHVISNNRIYESNFKSTGVIPNLAETIWTKVDGYLNDATYPDDTQSKLKRIVGYNKDGIHNIYELNADSSQGNVPDPSRKIWRNLELLEEVKIGELAVVRRPSANQYYTLRADSTSKTPTEDVLLWVDQGVIPYPGGVVSGKGSLFSRDGILYELVADSTDLPPKPPGETQDPLWRKLYLGDDSTNPVFIEPGRLFSNRQSGVESQDIFKLNTEISQTTKPPPLNPNREIKILRTLEEHPGAGTRVTNDKDYYIFEDDSSTTVNPDFIDIYTLNASATDLEPIDTSTNVIDEVIPDGDTITPPPLIFETTLRTGDPLPVNVEPTRTFRLGTEGTIYRANAELTELPDLNNPDVKVWEKIKSINANPDPFQTLPLLDSAGTVVLDPAGGLDIQEEVVYTHDSVRYIAYANVIRGKRIANGAVVDFGPSTIDKLWEDPGSVVLKDSGAVGKGEIATGNEEGPFEALAVASFPFNPADTIWKVSVQRVLTINASGRYSVTPPPSDMDSDYVVEEGEFYQFGSDLFLANGNIKEDTTISQAPAPGGIDLLWNPTPVAEFPFVPNERVTAGRVVVSSDGVFEAEAEITAASIDSTVEIWSKVQIEGVADDTGIPVVTTGDNRDQGTFFFAEGKGYFRVNADTESDAPEIGEDVLIWLDVRRSVDRYNPITVYNAFDLVQYEGGLFQARATFRDVIPTSSLLVWKPFDADNIPDFALNTAYREGSIVVTKVMDEDVIWKSTAATFGIAPSESEKQLTAQIPDPVNILQYNPLVTFDPESSEGLVYVEFEDGRIFRPVERVVGEDPESDPSKWKLVGTILDFSSARRYYPNCHVRFEGRVFRAKRIVEPGNPPKLDPDVTDDNWELVANSYPYKYFHRLKFERVDLSVDVRGIRSLILENDQGVIDPAKPFNPFGSIPKTGSNFFVGSEEVFQKRLVPSEELPALSLNIEWGELPQMSFSRYYTGYLTAESNVNASNGSGGTNTGGTGGGISSSSGLQLPRVNVSLRDASSNGRQPGEIYIEDNQHFKVELEVLENGGWRRYEEEQVDQNGSPVTVTDFNLFNDRSCPSTMLPDEKCPIPERDIVANETLIAKRRPTLGRFEFFDVSLQGGFMRLHLLQDFYHSEYSRSLATSAIKRAAEETNNAGSTDLVNEPYTPLINSISLDYFSREQINFRGKLRSDFNDRIDQFFHIYPFGQTEFFPIPEQPNDDVFTSQYLVPFFETTSFTNEGTPEPKDSNGNLYIGLQDVEPLQSIHILFQMAEGSEEPGRDKQPVTWAYLSNNIWKDIILPPGADDTNGLLRPGIVQLSLPRDITSDNSVLPKDVYWLRASVKDYADGVAKTIAVHPQAVRATFNINEDNADRVSTPIGPNTISSLLVRQAAIGSISQPFASFNGREKETDTQFYRRISERLRHKSRGISVVDYELLVLEAYTDVQQVKCLNHTSDKSEHTPGEVRLVAVPFLQNKNASDLLRPELSKNKRLEIRDFVSNHVSDFTSLDVISPLYEQVRFHVTVKFREGLDNAFYTTELKKDLVLFVSPWKKDEGLDLEFNRRVNEADVVNYIDGLTYVDFVKSLEVYHESTPDVFVPTKEAVPITSRSVLTSVPEIQHRVIAYTEKK